MIPGQICELRLSEDHRQLDLHGTHLFPCSCFNVDVRRNVGQEVPWHWHEEIEVIVMVEGKALVKGGGESWILEAGDGIFLNTNTLHSVQLVNGEICRLHSLVFSSDLLAGVPGSVFEQRYLRPMLNATCRAKPLRRNSPWEKEAVDAIEGAYTAYAEEPFGWELMVRGELSRLWMLVAGHTAQAESGLEENIDMYRLKEMLEYIHENFDKPILLENIAAAAKISVRECLRCFQRTIGVAPIQYLQKFRIRQASHLLVETDLPITEVGLRCGYESPSYFSSIFRRMTEQTPKDYRRYFAANQRALASSSALRYTGTDFETKGE